MLTATCAVIIGNFTRLMDSQGSTDANGEDFNKAMLLAKRLLRAVIGSVCLLTGG